MPDMPTKQGVDRRTAILRAAGRLFIKDGFSGVTMEDLLAEVGGSKATLYRYFSDKTELFQLAVEALLDERSAPLRSFTPTDPDAASTLKALGEHFADLVLHPVAIALHRLVTAEAERVPGLGQAFFDHGPAVGQAILGNYLTELADAGVVRLADAHTAGAQLYQAMLGDLQMRLLTNSPSRPTPVEVKNSIAMAVDIFLNGTLPRSDAD